MRQNALAHDKLQDAIAALNLAEFIHAMQAAGDAIARYSARFEIHRARALLPSRELQTCGLRFVSTETGLRPELLKLDYSRENCEHCIGIAQSLLEAPCSRSVWEQLYVCLQNFSNHVMHSSLSIAQKRVLLSLLHRMKFPLRRFIAEADSADRASAWVIGLLLQEPMSTSQALLRKHALHLELFYVRQKVEHLSPFVWRDRDSYAQWLCRNPGSRVLLTIHMGNFLGAFRHIAAQAEHGRHVLSLRRELHDVPELAYSADPRLRQQVLSRSSHTPGAVVKALREGYTTLAVFCDLGSQHGDTVEVPFFGMAARMVRGPALLAMAGAAPIVPFVTYEEDGRDSIFMEAVIPTALRPGETVAQGAARLTRTLAQLVERWVRRAPAQWRFLPSSAMYFNAPPQSGADS